MADAQYPAGAGSYDRCRCRFHRRSKGRAARFSLGGLRRRTTSNLAVVLERPCAGTQNKEEQGSRASHRTAFSAAELAPGLAGKSSQRLDVSEPRRQAPQPDALTANVIRPALKGSSIAMARMARLSPRLGDEPAPV